MGQNKVTKHFSVGNTFCQATMHAQFFVSVARCCDLGLWLNQQIIWKKKL